MLLIAPLLALTIAATPAEPVRRRGIFYAPAISNEYIVFSRGEKLWRVPREGGVATSLDVLATINSQPRFSPDGKRVALLTQFGGAYDLGTLPIEGGPLHRVTYYPRNGKGLQQWLPDGNLLYFTESDFRNVESQLYRVPAAGGLPQKLDLPFGADASLHTDGETLAHTQHFRRNLYWKRYQGGMASDIWLYNLRTGKSRKVTSWKGYDQKPMWSGDTLYYLSDSGAERFMNIWAYELKSAKRRQVTHFKGFDVQNPSMAQNGKEIAYAWRGDVYVLDLASEKERRIHIEIPAAAQEIAPRNVEAGNWTVSRTLAPDGERVAVEARGDIWVTPAADGTPRNLTDTDAVFERDPSWSPDGKWIACFSDGSGEYQLTLIDGANGSTKTLTRFQTGFRQTPKWSPNGKQIAFTDDAGKFFVCRVPEGSVKQFDKDPLGQVDPLSWSPDSRWITYHKYGKNIQTAIWAYDTDSGKTHQLTRGMARDAQPVFDPSGNWLLYLSARDFNRRVTDVLDRVAAFATPTVIVAVPLREGVPAPTVLTGSKQEQVEIEVDGFESRGVHLPIPSGRFSNLAVSDDGRAVYIRSTPLQENKLQAVALSPGAEEKAIVAGAEWFHLAGDKMLVSVNGKAQVMPFVPEAKPVGELATTGYSVEIEPTKEWAQISKDVWRLFRDYFYDPGMHGLAWDQQWMRFQGMFELCATREDVDYVLGEMISDLSVGHAMMTNPGDIGPGEPWIAPGQLGADYSLENGAFRITKIYRGAPWDPAGRGPLSQPGVEVREGEYLLAVNAKVLEASKDPWQAFAGTAGKKTTITVGPNPEIDSSSRKVEVSPLARESDLRMRHWVEKNRQYVERASGGKLGYLYLPDESWTGYGEFVRQFYGQTDKEGLLVDVRWTTGGNTSDRMIEMLNRPLLNAYAERYGEISFPIPENRIPGPKALLINGVTSSSGENFAYYFRKAGLGKVIGNRTWGGLIGVNGNQALIDGGFWWIPQSAFFVDEKKWMPEGIGVAPDIEVPENPAQMRGGRDPQLEAGVRHLMQELRTKGERKPQPPKIVKRS